MANDPKRGRASVVRRGWSSDLLPGKVFDTDGNAVGAQLLVWGPEDVDGEMCLMAKPADFDHGACAPNPNYDLEMKPVIAADDLQLAIPVRSVGFADEWSAVDDARLRGAALTAIMGGRVGRGALLAILEAGGLDPADL